MLDYADIDHTLIFFVSILSIFLTFRRTLHAWSICGALSLAYGIVAFDLHFSVANWLLPENTNPQYLTVAIFLIAGLAVLSRVILKSSRTLDRTLIGAATVSVGLTAYLFHSVLVMQILPAWAKDGAWSNSYLLLEPKDRFQSACAEANLTCWGGEDLPEQYIRADLRQQLVGVHSYYQETSPNEENGYGFGSFNDLRDEGVAVILYFSKPGDIRIIVDSATGKRIHTQVRDGFYLFSVVAHSIWTLGALFLIWFHKRRFGRRPIAD